MAAVRATVVVLVMVALGACSYSAHQLPTINGSGVSQDPKLEAVAKVFYDCMHDAGLPVELTENNNHQLAVVRFGDGHSVMARDLDGTSFAQGAHNAGKGDAAEQETIEDALGYDTDPVLVIDGVDHTGVYSQCLVKSGYKERFAWGVSVVDSSRIMAQMEANNRWAACARQNGWPAIEDSTMPTQTDGYDWPTVLLPTNITEDQLRQLLGVCPNFDPAQTQKLHDYLQTNPSAAGYPEGYLPDPDISFDAIPGDAASGKPVSPEEQALMDHESALYEILQSGRNESDERLYGDANGHG